jgi:glycerate dehydrogenase
MNIIVLDGHALNPGDLDWGPLEELGNLTLYERSDARQVVDRAREADVVLTNKALLQKKQLRELPNLKFISVMATGYNTVDVQTAKERGIQVSNVVGYSSDSVAQHAMALLLELSNNVGMHGSDVARGGWSGSTDWSYWKTPLIELLGKKLGIIGYGSIGNRTGQIARAFGMEVLVYHPRLQEGTKHYRLVTLDELFSQSDFISLHVPLNPDTQEIVNRDRLQQMKPSAFLINTSRGPLINEPDLKWALENKVISGAALDVLSSEPPSAEHPLIGALNCIITPHQAWASFESRSRLMEETVKNVEAFLKGEQRNRVV